jgi:hypothetical protein
MLKTCSLRSLRLDRNVISDAGGAGRASASIHVHWSVGGG